MQKGIYFFLAFIITFSDTFSQNCPNSDFSMLDFTNWQGYTGYNDGSGNSCCTNPGIVSGRHTIISNGMVDPHTCGGLTVPPAGEIACARLGNDINGAEAEQLIYTFTVDPLNPNFIYRYAVVLEDPGHEIFAQPFFSVKVLDINNNLVDPVCGIYEVFSAAGIPGFQTCMDVYGPVNWKDWATVGINLSSYAGQTLHIVFTTLDCAYGGHYGYAYILAECGSLTIDQSFCLGSDSVLLTAPSGFSYLWNTGDTTQDITVHNPVIGTTYYCDVTSVTGCGFSLFATISQTVLHPEFSFTNDTCSRTVTFTDSSYINNSSISQWQWDFGDGTFSDEQSLAHSFPGMGIYYVTLNISNSGGCDSSVTDTVTIGNVPYALFSGNDTCQSMEVFFNNFSVPTDSIISWLWDFGDSSPIDTVNWDTSHIYSIPGDYTVTLYVTNFNGCSDSMSYEISIFPVPVAVFTLTSPICDSATTTITFTGSSSPWTIFNWDFGGANIISGSGEGPYVVTWPTGGTHDISLELIDNVCNSVDDTAISIYIYPLPDADAGNDTTICLGGNAFLSGSGGISYYWTPAEGLSATNISNPVASPDITTTYTLFVTDSNCTASDNVTVTVVPLSPVIASNDTVICVGSVVQISASGGIGYQWTPSTGLSATNIPNPIASPQSTTTYNVTISDAIGCYATEGVIITVLDTPYASINVSDLSPCAIENIIVSYTGNASSYAIFSWDFDGANIISGSGDGPYLVNWSNSGNYNISLTVSESVCGSASANVPVTVNVLPFADAGNDDTTCLGGNVNLSASGGTSYYWSPSAGLSNTNISNPAASPGITTTYTVTVMNGGCSASDDVTVFIAPLSPVSAGTDTNICSGQNVQLTASGGTDYLWSPSSGLSSVNVPDPMASPVSTTTYTVTVSNPDGCFATAEVTVTVNIPPSSDFSVGSGPICSGNDVYVNYTGTALLGDIYNWDFDGGNIISGNGQGPYTISFPNGGSYNISLSVADAYCSSDITTLPVSVTQTPVASAGQDASICLGHYTTLQGSGGTIYTWSPSTWLNNANIANPVATPLQSITYTLTVSNGSCSATDEVLVTVTPLSPASAGTDTGFCSGSSVMLNATGGAYYSWSPSTGLSSTSIPNPVASPLNTATYTVTITASDGCYATDNITVFVYQTPSSTFSVSDITACSEDNILVTYTGSAGSSATYNWNFNGGTIVSGNGQGPYYINWQTQGNYIVTLSVMENNCTSSVTNVPVSVFQVMASVTNIGNVQCYGDNNGTASVYGTGGSLPYSYLWSNLQNGQTINNLPAGNYSVTVSDANGCNGTATAFINGPTSPINLNTYNINVTCENLCDGMIGTNVTGGTGPYTYIWSTSPQQTTPSVYDLCPDNYSVTVTDMNGCTSTGNVNLPFTTSINSSFISDVTFGYIPFTVHFTYTGTNAYSFYWDFGDGTTSTLQDPTHIYNSTGTYPVILIITGPGQCTDTYYIYIIAEDISVLEVPNVFTPNGDGKNDYLEIQYNYIGEFVLKIFNRWGNLIYESDNESSFWDGNNRSNLPVPEGTYYYVIEATGKDHVIYSLNGFITIFR
ncbi:MAG: PKD domain-containing protein [Bacteroidota bacterium]